MDPKDTSLLTGIPRPRFKTIEQVEDDFNKELAHLYLTLEKAFSSLRAHDDILLKLKQDFELCKKSNAGLESRIDKFMNATIKKLETISTHSAESDKKIQIIQIKIAEISKQKKETDDMLKNYSKQFSELSQRISKLEDTSLWDEFTKQISELKRDIFSVKEEMKNLYRETERSIRTQMEMNKVEMERSIRTQMEMNKVEMERSIRTQMEMNKVEMKNLIDSGFEQVLKLMRK